MFDFTDFQITLKKKKEKKRENNIMGQLQSLLSREERFEYEEDGKNGLIMVDKYIPEELLSELLFHVDAKTLLNCQLVCKRWNTILRSYVWRKKAERIIGRQLHFDKEINWHLYYVICSKKSLEKNFIKNHSGRYGIRYWNVLSEGGDGWIVECPPKGALPLPITDNVFEGKEHCFATSYYSCSKEQTIDLLSQGLLPELLDEIQPTIVASLIFLLFLFYLFVLNRVINVSFFFFYKD